MERVDKVYINEKMAFSSSIKVLGPPGIVPIKNLS